MSTITKNRSKIFAIKMMCADCVEMTNVSYKEYKRRVSICFHDKCPIHPYKDTLSKASYNAWIRVSKQTEDMLLKIEHSAKSK